MQKLHLQVYCIIYVPVGAWCIIHEFLRHFFKIDFHLFMQNKENVTSHHFKTELQPGMTEFTKCNLIPFNSISIESKWSLPFVQSMYKIYCSCIVKIYIPTAILKILGKCFPIFWAFHHFSSTVPNKPPLDCL